MGGLVLGQFLLPPKQAKNDASFKSDQK